MSKIIIIIVFLLSANLFSQGFDWQISPRFPIEMPNQFYGAGIDYMYADQFGNFNLIENQISCCQFTNGNGKKYALYLFYENWINGLSSFNISLSYNYLSSLFDLQSTLPIRDGDFTTKYKFSSQMQFIGLGAFYKRRVPNTLLNFSGGINFLINIYNKQNHTEYAISNNVPFKERNLSNGSINSANTLLLEPFLQFGTDLDLGIGMYASPNIRISYSLNSYIQYESWHSFMIGLNLRIYKNFDL